MMTESQASIPASQPHPMDVHVGKRLRMQRMLLGLSQKAVGEQVGVTFQQIQKYERGINRVSAGLLHDFARVMQVPVNFFFDGQQSTQLSTAAHAGAVGFAESESAGYDAGAPSANSKEAMDILRAYHKISDQTLRKKVLDLMRAMADTPSAG